LINSLKTWLLWQPSRSTSTRASHTFYWATAWVLSQQLILDHSDSIDGLALSGSGTLDSLIRIAQSVSTGQDPMKLMNAPFEPARTPLDWLSRDNAEVDAFVADPLCFPSLTTKSMESFSDASPRLASRKRSPKRERIFPYTFSPAATIPSDKD